MNHRRSHFARRAPALFALLAAAVVALGLATASAQAGELIAGAPKPVAITVQDRDGRDHDPRDLGGTLTLVHFWASWCASCRTEFPAIDALQRDLRGEGLRVAAVSLDRLGWPMMDRTTQSLGIHDVAIFHDLNREAAQKLAIAGLPTTVVLDAQGREIARLIGPGDWQDEALRTKLRDLAKRP